METVPMSRRVRRYAVNALCMLVSAVALIFVVPAAFGLQRYVIAGQSMTGTYDLGSVVFDKVVPVADLKVGDVITYLPPPDSGVDHLVTHRIYSMKPAARGTRLRTKGDANPAPDPWTFRLTAHTQPVVSFHLPYVGFVFLALQNRGTRMLVIGVPAALIALLSMGELVGALRRRPGNKREPEPPPSTSVVLVDGGLLPAQRVAGARGGQAADTRTRPEHPAHQ